MNNDVIYASVQVTKKMKGGTKIKPFSYVGSENYEDCKMLIIGSSMIIIENNDNTKYKVIPMSEIIEFYLKEYDN